MSEQKSEFKFIPKMLVESDTEMIGKDEMEILMKQPTEQDSLWEAVPDKTYTRASETEVLKKCTKFYGVLLDTMEEKDPIKNEKYTHIVLGGMTFTKGFQNKIVRNIYKDYSKSSIGGGSGGKPQFKPKYLDEVYLGDIDEINNKVKSGNWQLSNPAVVIDGKILIVRNK